MLENASALIDMGSIAARVARAFAGRARTSPQFELESLLESRADIEAVRLVEEMQQAEQNLRMREEGGFD